MRYIEFLQTIYALGLISHKTYQTAFSKVYQIQYADFLEALKLQQ